jgi:hypothetical protein
MPNATQSRILFSQSAQEKLNAARLACFRRASYWTSRKEPVIGRTRPEHKEATKKKEKNNIFGFTDGVNESATLQLMDTKKAACNFPLYWWHATSDANECKSVFFGSNGRTPETHTRSAFMRVHVADLVGLRARAFTIGIALQSLCLPAWITLLIVQAACVGSEFVPLVTKIKHCTQRIPIGSQAAAQSQCWQSRTTSARWVRCTTRRSPRTTRRSQPCSAQRANERTALNVSCDLQSISKSESHT